jgi:hypothetical protein
MVDAVLPGGSATVRLVLDRDEGGRVILVLAGTSE